MYYKENSLYFKDFFLFMFDKFIDFLDVFVYLFLNFFLTFVFVVLCELLFFFHLFDDIVHLTTDIAEGDLPVFSLFLDDFNKFFPPFFTELRNGKPYRLSVWVGVFVTVGVSVGVFVGVWVGVFVSVGV